MAYLLANHLTEHFPAERHGGSRHACVLTESALADTSERAMSLAQAVEALRASCGSDLQGLNTHIHCPRNNETVDLSEGASSVRMVRLCAGGPLSLGRGT